MTFRVTFGLTRMAVALMTARPVRPLFPLFSRALTSSDAKAADVDVISPCLRIYFSTESLEARRTAEAAIHRAIRRFEEAGKRSPVEDLYVAVYRNDLKGVQVALNSLNWRDRRAVKTARQLSSLAPLAENVTALIRAELSSWMNPLSRSKPMKDDFLGMRAIEWPIFGGNSGPIEDDRSWLSDRDE